MSPTMSLTATAFLCYRMASMLKIMSLLPRENPKGLHEILQLQHLPKLRVAQTWVWDCRAGKGTEPPTLDWSMVALSLMIAYMFFPLSSPTLLPGLSWAWPLVWFLLSKASKMGLLSPTHHEERTSTPVTYLLPPSPLLMLYDILRKIDSRALGN